MDAERDLQKAKWLLVGVLLFFIGGCMSWGELMYLIRGQNAQATITKVFETRSRRGGASLSVEYEFNEPGGGRRRGHFGESLNWSPPGDGKVMVRYTPGEDGDSRLSGRVSWIGLGLFFGSLAVIVGGIIVMGREAHDDKPRKHARG